MLEYSVFEKDAKCGTVQAEADGLYWRVRARCEVETGQPRRLYARNGEQTLNLGVLMPEGDDWVLEKRVSARTFCFTEDTEISFDENGWLPFSGELMGCPVENAKRRGDRVAFPFEAEMPLPVMQLFCFLTPESVEGQPCLVLDLSKIENKNEAL